MEGLAGLEAEADQVLDELGLAVDDDRPPVCEVAQRDPVPLACELQLDAVVDEALALEAISGFCLDQEVDDALLDHARTDARLDVLAAPVFEDHRVDALAVQKVTEHESRRAGADDAHLRAGSGQVPPSSSSTRWAIANAPLAAGTPQ